jgi:hypothetical protein
VVERKTENEMAVFGKRLLPFIAHKVRRIQFNEFIVIGCKYICRERNFLPVIQSCIDLLSEFDVWAGLCCTLLCRTATENEGKIGITFPFSHLMQFSLCISSSQSLVIDMFTKLRKATINSVLSVRLSGCPHGTSQLSLDESTWKLTFVYFLTICKEN